MKIKTVFTILLALTVALALAIGGCGADDAGDDVERLLMATGGTGGTYYPLGGAMAEAWNNNIEGINVSTESTGASVENLRLLGSGESDLAMAMNGPAMAAYEGTGDFEGNPIDFRAVGVIYPEVMQVVAPEGEGINEIEDLVGKRVSLGPPGSGTASAAEAILEAYDIDPDEDIDKFQDTFADAATKLKDGHLDAAFAVLAVPAGNIIDITTATPVNIVNITGEGLDRLLEEDPTFSTYEIPAGTYDGQEDTAYTISQWAVLYVPPELDEDLVYQLTKVMYENTEEIARAHDRGRQITIDNAMSGIDPVPFHPGAERYYQEIGLID